MDGYLLGLKPKLRQLSLELHLAPGMLRGNKRNFQRLHLS